MQPNLRVASGSKEPDENVNIWFKHGKNLYKGQQIINGLWTSGTTVASNSSGWYIVIPIIGGYTYTVSRKNGKANNSTLSLGVLTTSEYPKNGTTIIDTWKTDSTDAKQVTIQTSSNANYLFIAVAAGNSTVVTDTVKKIALEELQVEIEDSKTKYEEPIEDDILVKKDKGYNSIFPKTIKIFEETNEDYDIRLRAYRSGKIIMITIYAIDVKKQIASGANVVTLGKLGSENAPLESFIKMCHTSAGQRFNVQVSNTGNVQISYVYNSIAVANQIVDAFTYLAK